MQSQFARHSLLGAFRRVTLLVLLSARMWAQAADLGEWSCRPLSRPHFQFEGPVGTRIQQNLDHWLLTAPAANPGMLQMFRVRDRQPRPELVPWAGEFVGKYLISAIQAARMTDRADLEAVIRQTIDGLLATQALDGYMGPFPREARLQGNWDLWGHYHVLLALLIWHDATEDPKALEACRRAADLVCRTYLGSGRRIFDAGSHEMNMAIVHALGQLYRHTRESRYLAMMREIERDWERAGDYLRTGLAGLEFFETPRPRWESLHDLQGLGEFYRITGDDRYKRAFLHHWRSILRWDRRNTGGFSSGEQATGNPYAPTAIETCCTVAWMTLTLDALQLTGEGRAADELELSFYNAALGAQHPSGRWCTYNTPMNGVREASAHTIVFQARAGSPELNCCSVNGPRGLGLLSEWAVMQGHDGLWLNYYGPGRCDTQLEDGTPIRLHTSTEYPIARQVLIEVTPGSARSFALYLRIPGWSRRTVARLNNLPLSSPRPGTYMKLSREWHAGDQIRLEFEMDLRVVPGDREAAGQVSVYRGPLLLAYDQALNEIDPADVPALDLSHLPDANRPLRPSLDGPLAPWLALDVPCADGRSVRLCDFASAGAKGTPYRSWLPAQHPLPPAVVTRFPRDEAAVPPGDLLFRWTGPKRTNTAVARYELLIGKEGDPDRPLVRQETFGSQTVLTNGTTPLDPRREYWWKVIAWNSYGATESVGPPARFYIDPTAEPIPVRLPDPARQVLSDPLTGTAKVASRSRGSVTAAPGPEGQANGSVMTDGKDSLLVYSMDEFPDEEYTVALWVKFSELPPERLAQVCSAWTGPMDDPARLCLEHGKLFGRLESGQGYSTSGVPVRTGVWYHVALVKSGTQLKLIVNGRTESQVAVPLYVQTRSLDLALGGNPHYAGNEFLGAQFARFQFLGRALSPNELREPWTSSEL